MMRKMTLAATIVGAWALTACQAQNEAQEAPASRDLSDQGSRDQGSTDQGSTDQGSTDQGSTDQGSVEK